jgi:hypothetical protein
MYYDVRNLLRSLTCVPVLTGGHTDFVPESISFRTVYLTILSIHSTLLVWTDIQMSD